MSEYRENEDAFEPTTDTIEIEGSIEEAADAPQGIIEDLNENGIDDDIVTAVLLIQNRQGAVLPVTNLETLKMDRQANAHEVLRMCADVQDQISAIRVVGELAQIFQHVNQTSLQSVANMMNLKVNGNSEPES
mgnify:CR=1 FL=1